MRFLARAGGTLTASLDYGNIVETLAQLPVPFMADLCIVDLLENGAVRCAAVAAGTSELQALVRPARMAHPVDLASEDPIAVAITKGVAHFQGIASEQSCGIPAITPDSMIVLPLVARGQTLGAMTFLTTRQGGRRYSESDFAVAQELTHRAGIALDNARLYRDVQEASRLKDEFLGIVSHELRTPLNAVLGWSQVLRRAPADPEQTRRAVEAIERNAQAQVRLVEDLLDTSRVISGKIRLELSSVDVSNLIGGAVESFGPVARAAGLELSATVAEDVGATRADGARLQQVVGNLLSNSVKFTPAGGRIDVAVRRTASSLEIRVSDTGAGITSEFLPHVFDRFRQADSTTTRAHGGLGIGLAIVRHLVELHGGTIRAASGGAGHGSTFTIVLPSDEVPQPEERRSSPALSRPASRLNGARVLAVDDSTDALELIRTVLTEAGALVSTALSVEGARQQIESDRPDVLVADIGMPGQDGYALIRLVRGVEAMGCGTRLP
ncbi:MAG: hybrid sensor histidine kinase/response regulator, partial [Geminicoccales bacterium]